MPHVFGDTIGNFMTQVTYDLALFSSYDVFYRTSVNIHTSHLMSNARVSTNIASVLYNLCLLTSHSDLTDPRHQSRRVLTFSQVSHN